eukprot:Hpha_TRINITY_DN16118_c1_g20::TRINITY_DN16118_c1_g20_i1::g.8233::m.8233
MAEVHTDPAAPRPHRKYPFLPRRRNFSAEARQQERSCFGVSLGEGDLGPLGETSASPRLKGLRLGGDKEGEGKGQKRYQRDVGKRLNWKEQRLEVLQRYTTTENIPVRCKITDEDEGGGGTDRAKARLEQLEEADGEKRGELSYYTQKELVSQMEKYAVDLEAAWNSGEKVRALRIVIQACKMLCTVRCPPMYPSLFALVARVLDAFGSLVFDRIYQKAIEAAHVKRLPDDFTGRDTPPEAKDMCRNWFFKVASIRELIPRVLVEMALWRCNRFVVPDVEFFSESLARFAKQCRGVGDTLIAHHMRFYLCLRGGVLLEDFGSKLSPEFASLCIEDFYYVNKVQLKQDRFTQFLAQNKMTEPAYTRLFQPFVRWAFEALSENNASSFAAHLEEYSNNCGWGFVLEQIIQAYPSAEIVAALPRIQDEIRRADDSNCPRYRLWTVLGKALCESPPEGKAGRAAVLTEAWECALASGNEGLLECATVWVQFATLHMGRREVGNIFTGIRGCLGEARVQEGDRVGVARLLSSALEYSADPAALLAAGDFLPLLDTLLPEQRAAVSASFLEAFGAQGQTTSDPVIVGGLFDLGRSIHERITAMSDPEEVDRCASLVVGFMQKVDYARDNDQQLGFLVECRGSFTRLQGVVEECVWACLRLLRRVIQSHGGVVKSHTKKLGAFAKACILFCHLTIPSLRDAKVKAQLYTMVGGTAFTFGFLPQGEALLLSAVGALAEIPIPPQPETQGGANKIADETDAWIARLVAPLIGLGLIAPGSAKQGGLWLFDAIISFAAEREWGDFSAAASRVYMYCIPALAAMHQDRLPYHFPSPYGAPSNDDLFGGEEVFCEEVCDMAADLTERVVTEMHRLQGILSAASTPPPMKGPLRQRLCNVGLDLIEVVASTSEITQQSSAPLVGWLWEVVKSHADGDEGVVRRSSLVFEYLQHSGDPAVRAISEQLQA